MALKWNDLPIETKSQAVNDAPGWSVVFPVPEDQEWLVVGWSIWQGVSGPQYNAVYKRINVVIPNDWDANYNDVVVMEKGLGGISTEKTLERGTINGVNGIEVSGGKQITFSQAAGETLGGLIGIIVYAIVRRSN